MKLGLTRKQLKELFEQLEADEIVDYVLDLGIEVQPPTIIPFIVPSGVYRRELGEDLIFCSNQQAGASQIFRVDLWGGPEQPIQWNLFTESDQWVLIIDHSNFPVIDGHRIQFDDEGNLA